MVVIMKREFSPGQLEAAVRAMEAGGVRVMVSKGSETTILGAEGDAGGLNQEQLAQLPGVERVMRVSEPYKKANRKYHPDDSVIGIGGGVSIGGTSWPSSPGPARWRARNRSWRWPDPSRLPGPLPFGEALTSPAPPPTPSRARGWKGCSCWTRPERPPACPSCPS